MGAGRRRRPPRARWPGCCSKAVARAVRVGQARRLGWAGLAAVGGYSDQPHLHREFRALAGLTPVQALRDWTRATFVQYATDAEPLAFFA